MHGDKGIRCFGVCTTRIAALVLALGMLSELSMAQETASGIDFQFLDDANGFGVSSAEVKWGRVESRFHSSLSQSAVSSAEGRLPLKLSPGEYVFEISASGYRPMRGHETVTLSSMPFSQCQS